jgi:hypothetical protein
MTVDFMLKQVLNEGRFSRFRDADDPSSQQLLLERLAGLQLANSVSPEPLEEWVQEAGAITLSARNANILYFTDRLCEQCELQSDLEPELLLYFQRLRPFIAAFFVTHEEAVHSLQHPFLELIDQLWQAARYWSPDLGKQGEKYRTRIDDVLVQLQQADPVAAPFDSWQESFFSQWQKDIQRAALLSSRICETERSSLAGKNAEQVVRRQIHALLLRAEMPAIVASLIKEPFRHSLKLIFSAHGADSQQWHAAMSAIHDLQDSMRTPQTAEEKQHSYQLIPQVPDALRACLVSIADPAEMDVWIEQVEALHMRILIGSAVELHVAELPSSLSDTVGVNANISEALLEKVALIPVGNWIIYQRENGEVIRCRLVLKLDDVGQMLFVNVLGAKCLEKTFEEFAYLLAARHVRLMNEDNHFSQILNDVVSQLIQLYEKQSLLQANVREREQKEAERRRFAQEKARIEAEVLERQRREFEAKTAERAKIEAESLAQKQRELDKQAIEEAALLAQQQSLLDEQRKVLEVKEGVLRAKLLQEQAQLQEREAAMQTSRILGVGAWVEMEVEGIWQKCKLAAVINATGKLIFTNREGRKVFEPKRDEIVDMLLTSRIVVIETGSQFEHSLQKVIQSMRSD